MMAWLEEDTEKDPRVKIRKGTTLLLCEVAMHVYKNEEVTSEQDEHSKVNRMLLIGDDAIVFAQSHTDGVEYIKEEAEEAKMYSMKKRKKGKKVNFNDFIAPPFTPSQEDDTPKKDVPSQEDVAPQDDDASLTVDITKNNFFDLTLPKNNTTSSVRSSQSSSDDNTSNKATTLKNSEGNLKKTDVAGSIWDHRNLHINKEVMTCLYESSEEEN
eukprot:scaffold203651_cov30-Attheya_sp.AAC.1